MNSSPEGAFEKLSLDGANENTPTEGADAHTKVANDQLVGRIENSVVEHELSSRRGKKQILVKIDRALVSNSWLLANPKWRCKILKRKFSNHSPVMGWCNKNTRPDNDHFRFRKIWLEHNQFMNMVKLSWSESMCDGPIRLVMRKLKRLKGTLKAWHKNTYWGTRDKIAQANKSLKDIQK
ncbi:hypothetical protein IFM89_005939 [Coptis chinensis]|uniref:Uncharacterized protein n=1 Tax=Coptis chinensis TaxID=261450 RepID=A0A835IC70_9MAGN|nr:hypothetical protein IFM89_005939 [Coptis chinensis]